MIVILSAFRISLRKTPGWRVIRQQGIRNLPPRLQAKYYKIMHHRLFVQHFRNFLSFYDSTAHICTTSIWIGRQFYDEALFCCDFPKYRGFPLQEQVDYYRRKGYPEKNGLMAAGIIVREMGVKALSRIAVVE